MGCVSSRVKRNKAVGESDGVTSASGRPSDATPANVTQRISGEASGESNKTTPATAARGESVTTTPDPRGDWSRKSSDLNYESNRKTTVPHVESTGKAFASPGESYRMMSAARYPPVDVALTNERRREFENTNSSRVQLQRDKPGDLLGYMFNNAGELRDVNGHRYGARQSPVTENDQLRGELLEKITALVHEQLVNVYGLQKIAIPIDAMRGEPRSFIFASQDAWTTKGKLLILIHGSGGCVAGIWSRKVILQDNLYRGSQMEYIGRALSEGYEVVLLNTNVNFQMVTHDNWSGNAPIRGSENPIKHALYVWDNLIFPCSAEHVAIMAHSYGGVVTTSLACMRKDTFLERVFAVAFSDSVHHINHNSTPHEVVKFYRNNARNWVTSSLPLDTPVDKSVHKQSGNDARRVSAGDERHEWTSPAAFNSVFAFFDLKFKERCSVSKVH